MNLSQRWSGREPGVIPLSRRRAAQKPKPLRRPPPTGEDLATTAIKVCNVNRVRNLAHQPRELLDDEGYWVSAIANYWHFGMEQTTIYYHGTSSRCCDPAILSSGISGRAKVTLVPCPRLDFTFR